MRTQLNQMRQLWDVVLSVQTFISDSRDILWREIQPELLEEESKARMKYVERFVGALSCQVDHSIYWIIIKNFKFLIKTAKIGTQLIQPYLIVKPGEVELGRHRTHDLCASTHALHVACERV